MSVEVVFGGGASKGLAWRAESSVAGYKPVASGNDLVGTRITKSFLMDGEYEQDFEGVVVGYDGPGNASSMLHGAHWEVEYSDGDVEKLSFADLLTHAGEEEKERVQLWAEAMWALPMSRGDLIQAGSVRVVPAEGDGDRPPEYDAVRDSMLNGALRDTAIGSELTDECMALYCALLRLSEPEGVHVVAPDAVAACAQGTACPELLADLHRAEMVVAPLHFPARDDQPEHWALLLVNNGTKKITVLDSAKRVPFKARKEMVTCVSSLLGSDYRVTTYDRMPQQENDIDCGVFVLEAARCLMRRAPLAFTQAHMPKIRRRIAFELFADRLIDDDPIDENGIVGRRVVVVNKRPRS